MVVRPGVRLVKGEMVMNGELVLTNLVSMKDREATSASVLLSPAIERQWSGDARCVCWRRARARSRCAAITEVVLVSLKVQLTADVLSQ